MTAAEQPPTTPPPPPPPPPPTPSASGEPVELTMEYPEHIANWRPLAHWLLGIPQAIVAAVLSAVFGLLVLISFFSVLFTKQIPRSLFDFMAMTMRYQWRTNAYLFFMRESYPPFDFTSANGADDPRLPADPARVGVAYPDELNRWLPLVKWLLAIPHYIVLMVLGIGAWVVTVIAFFAVLFTGRWPRGMFDYVVGVQRWGMRVNAYVGLMRDEYPPFSLS